MGAGREISPIGFEKTAVGRMMLALAIPLVKLGVTYVRFPGLVLSLVKYACRWHAGVRRKEIRVGDHHWVYLDGGQGEPIVLVHGFAADKDRYGTFLPGFTRSYRVIVPDLPGFGESTYIPSKKYGLLEQTYRLRRFLEALGLDRVTLVRMSMGGAICGSFAAEYPDRVKRLILMNTIGIHPPVLSDAWQLYKTRAINIFLYDSIKGFDEMLAHLFYRPPWVPSHFKAHLVRESIASAPISKKIMADIITEGLEPLEHRLDRLRSKTLILWGAEDRITHVSGVGKLHAGIQDSQAEILAACGHVPFIEKPEETYRAISKFLAE